MCGRFAQPGLADYLRELQAEQDVVSGYDNHPIARYNVAPGSRVLVLHNAEDGLRIDPATGVGRRSGPRTNAPRRSMPGSRP
jgi:putative SOS response-associated peptidase YedK